MLVITAGIHKMLARIVNREDPEQSDMGLQCLSKHFWQAARFQNLRTSTILISIVASRDITSKTLIFPKSLT